MVLKTWSITGVSRGFSKALTEAVIARGHAVVGITRDGAAPFANSSSRLTTLALDVTDAAAVPVVIEQAVGSRAGSMSSSTTPDMGCSARWKRPSSRTSITFSK